MYTLYYCQTIKIQLPDLRGDRIHLTNYNIHFKIDFYWSLPFAANIKGVISCWWILFKFSLLVFFSNSAHLTSFCWFEDALAASNMKPSPLQCASFNSSKDFKTWCCEWQQENPAGVRWPQPHTSKKGLTSPIVEIKQVTSSTSPAQ